MKNKSKELDVDFIGGQRPMTIEEEKAISEYIRMQKLLKTKKPLRLNKPTTRKKVIA
jgi:hypothetical protein